MDDVTQLLDQSPSPVIPISTYRHGKKMLSCVSRGSWPAHCHFMVYMVLSPCHLSAAQECGYFVELRKPWQPGGLVSLSPTQVLPQTSGGANRTVPRKRERAPQSRDRGTRPDFSEVFCSSQAWRPTPILSPSTRNTDMERDNVPRWRGAYCLLMIEKCCTARTHTPYTHTYIHTYKSERKLCKVTTMENIIETNLIF